MWVRPSPPPALSPPSDCTRALHSLGSLPPMHHFHSAFMSTRLSDFQIVSLSIPRGFPKMTDSSMTFLFSHQQKGTSKMCVSMCVLPVCVSTLACLQAHTPNDKQDTLQRLAT